MKLPGRTIAAIATGRGGGVGIVRISGEEALRIGRSLFRPFPDPIESHRLYLGHVVRPAASAGAAAEVIDQVLFCLMRGPRSYTGEDVVELHGHGGARNLERLLEACLAAGATLAEPGEFTKRAFLAGKLDLTRAEAVAALVEAQSEQAIRHAQRQLAGELGQKVSELRRRSVRALAELEGQLDFPDLDEDAAQNRELERELSGLGAAVEGLARGYRRGGKALASGIELVLLGRTNAGKSSLVNALCESERVLVDERPGTTRDFVEVRAHFGEVPVTLIDTAGDRPEMTDLERHGLLLAQARAAHADLALLVVDGTLGLSSAEERLLAALPESLPKLVVWNKIDHTRCQPPPDGAVGCSALCGSGLSSLRSRVLELLAPDIEASGELVVSARQAALFDEAAGALSRAQALLSSAQAAELIAAELRRAADRLGEVTGEVVSERVLDEVFARFCVGK